LCLGNAKLLARYGQLVCHNEQQLALVVRLMTCQQFSSSLPFYLWPLFLYMIYLNVVNLSSWNYMNYYNKSIIFLDQFYLKLISVFVSRIPLPFALLLDIFKRSTFRAVKKRYILLYNVHEIAGWIIMLKEEKFADSKG
jgi:hypothetical protein